MENAYFRDLDTGRVLSQASRLKVTLRQYQELPMQITILILELRLLQGVDLGNQISLCSEFPRLLIVELLQLDLSFASQAPIQERTILNQIWASLLKRLKPDYEQSFAYKGILGDSRNPFLDDELLHCSKNPGCSRTSRAKKWKFCRLLVLRY